jgi:hypothetical protein
VANKIDEIIQDVQHRIGEYDGNPPFTKASILRTINRIYKQLNSELKCLEKFHVYAAGTFDDDVYYVEKPEQMIMPYRFTDEDNNIIALDYVQPELWSKETSGATFTIMGINTLGVGQQMYFSGVDAETAFIIWYYASGSELVDKDDADVGTGEANTPEWQLHYYDALYYGASIQLKQDYPMYESDVVQFNRLKKGLRESHYRKQMGVTPEIPGGIGISRNLDDYDIMGQR